MNWLNQVWAAISENAGSGAQTTGQVADGIINAGLNVAALAQLLQNIAYSADATPAEVAYAQNELRYIQQRYAAPEKSSLLPLLLLAGVLVIASRD